MIAGEKFFAGIYDNGEQLSLVMTKLAIKLSTVSTVPVPVPVPQQCVISIEQCVRECEAVPKFGRGFRSEGGEVWEGAVISCIKQQEIKKYFRVQVMMTYLSWSFACLAESRTF
jgi:hypothetical protein